MAKLTQEEAKAYGYLAVVVVIILTGLLIINKVFGGISAFLEKIGLKDDKATVDANESIADVVKYFNDNPRKSAWSPLYYKEINKTSEIYILKQADRIDIAMMIELSVTPFKDFPEEGMRQIKRCSYKTQISYLAEYFAQRYSVDLLTWLNYHYDTDHQRQVLKQICDYVHNLPTGKK